MTSRRRAHEDKDNDDKHYGKRPRRHLPVDFLDIIHNRMAELGHERGSSLELRLENLATFLLNTLDDYKRDILCILMKYVEKYSTQSVAYATLVGLINIKRFEFGGEAMQIAMLRLGEQMRVGSWKKASCLLCFVAGLVCANVVTASSYLQLLTLLIKECKVEPQEVKTENPVKMETANKDALEPIVPQQQNESWMHKRHDWVIYSVLSTLPFVGRELFEKKEAGLIELLMAIQVYVKKTFNRRQLYNTLFRVWNTANPEQLECLDVLWHHIEVLHLQGWREICYLIRCPYMAFDTHLCGALNHTLPAFEIPNPYPFTTLPPPPISWMVFRIFDFDQSTYTHFLPGAHGFERFVIDRELEEIFKLSRLDRQLCANRFLVYAEIIPEISLSHCIVEFLVGKILQLPLDPNSPKLIGINCAAILIELCKLRPTKMTCIISEAVEILYRQLSTMNVACFDSFVNWFSHYLCNYRFEFNWFLFEINSSLISNTDENLMLQPNAIFLRELFKKLSFYDNIAQLIPEPFLMFMPPSPIPHFKYIDERLPGSQLSKGLLVAMRKKCAPEKVIEILTSNTSLTMLNKINILMQCIVHLGSKSFSHSNCLFKKFNVQLKFLAISEDEQHCMLAAIFDVWKFNDQFKYVTIEKLLRMGIIDAKSIISWFFAPGQKQELTKIYAWEVIYTTVRVIKFADRRSESDPGDVEKRLRILLFHVIRRIIKSLSLHQQSKKITQMQEENQQQLEQQQQQEQPQQEQSQQEQPQQEQPQQEQPQQEQPQQEQPQQKQQQQKEQTQSNDPDFWYLWMLGRFTEFLLMHRLELWKLRDRLKGIEEVEQLKGVPKIIHAFLSLDQ